MWAGSNFTIFYTSQGLWSPPSFTTTQPFYEGSIKPVQLIECSVSIIRCGESTCKFKVTPDAPNILGKSVKIMFADETGSRQAGRFRLIKSSKNDTTGTVEYEGVSELAWVLSGVKYPYEFRPSTGSTWKGLIDRMLMLRVVTAVGVTLPDSTGGSSGPASRRMDTNIMSQLSTGRIADRLGSTGATPSGLVVKEGTSVLEVLESGRKAGRFRYHLDDEAGMIYLMPATIGGYNPIPVPKSLVPNIDFIFDSDDLDTARTWDDLRIIGAGGQTYTYAAPGGGAAYPRRVEVIEDPSVGSQGACDARAAELLSQLSAGDRSAKLLLGSGGSQKYTLFTDFFPANGLDSSWHSIKQLVVSFGGNSGWEAAITFDDGVKDFSSSSKGVDGSHRGTAGYMGLSGSSVFAFVSGSDRWLMCGKDDIVSFGCSFNMKTGTSVAANAIINNALKIDPDFAPEKTVMCRSGSWIVYILSSGEVWFQNATSGANVPGTPSILCVNATWRKKQG